MNEHVERVGKPTGLSQAEPQSSQGLGPSGFDPSRIAEVIDESGGFWRSCSGCYETEDGYPVGHYPHSEIFQATLGGGCSECGGLGVIWDNTDWADFAEWSIERDRSQANIEAVLSEHLRVYDGRIMGLRDAAYAILNLSDSDGSPKGGDACGSVHDSAGLQGIARKPAP